MFWRKSKNQKWILFTSRKLQIYRICSPGVKNSYYIRNSAILWFYGAFSLVSVTLSVYKSICIIFSSLSLRSTSHKCLHNLSTLQTVMNNNYNSKLIVIVNAHRFEDYVIAINSVLINSNTNILQWNVISRNFYIQCLHFKTLPLELF